MVRLTTKKLLYKVVQVIRTFPIRTRRYIQALPFWKKEVKDGIMRIIGTRTIIQRYITLTLFTIARNSRYLTLTATMLMVMVTRFKTALSIPLMKVLL